MQEEGTSDVYNGNISEAEAGAAAAARRPGGLPAGLHARLGEPCTVAPVYLRSIFGYKIFLMTLYKM